MTKIILLILLILPSPAAFAWGPSVHHAMASRILEHEAIEKYLPLFGLDKTAVIEASTEPMPAEIFQWCGWQRIKNDGKEHNDFFNDPNFTRLSLTKFVGFILHNCADCGVPLGHSPANELLDNKLLEAILESGYDSTLPIPLWSALAPYSGSYSQKIKTFYKDQIELTRWFKTHLSPAVLKTVGKKGIQNGLRLGQAVILDVFLTLDPGDANYDGRVDEKDFGIVLWHYGDSNARSPGQGDLNGDSLVDLTDVRLVLNHFHRSPAGGPQAATLPPAIPPASKMNCDGSLTAIFLNLTPVLWRF